MRRVSPREASCCRVFLLESRFWVHPFDRPGPDEARDGMAQAFEWPSADHTTQVVAECPNCADTDTKRIVFRAPWPNGKTQDGWALLVGCANCGCGFFHPASPPDYGADPVGGEAALAFYLQQGAGLWSITSNLAALNRPAGTRFLEVGCGFGFGLDFARRALG